MPHILQRITSATEVRNILGMFANHVQCKKGEKKSRKQHCSNACYLYISQFYFCKEEATLLKDHPFQLFQRLFILQIVTKQTFSLKYHFTHKNNG